jgi:hypothetical protein
VRASDVLACDVVTAAGQRVGRVRDLRLVMDGPVRGALAMLRVDELLVGGDALAGRLGYLRGGVRGPALLAAVMRRLEARAQTVAVDDVETWDLEARRLVLRPGVRPGRDPDG